MKTHNIPFAVSGILLLFLASALMPHLPVGAQPLSYLSDPNKDLDDKVKLFFDEIIRSNSSKAFESKAFDDLLRSTSGSEKLDGMKTKLDEAKDEFGSFRKYEKVDVKPVGDDLVFVRYLLKCERQPIVWTFTFYRRPSETGTTTLSSWSLIGLRFDTNLDPLLQLPSIR
jgi:hypothetical protein